MKLLWEKHWPSFVAVGAFVLAMLYAESFFSHARLSSWKVEALYNSMFNIASAASAFLFAFYTYVRTASGDILVAIRKSIYFKRASSYILRSITFTALFAVVTVPFLIVEPKPESIMDLPYWVVATWCAAACYGLATIARSVYHFIAILDAAFGERLEG